MRRNLTIIGATALLGLLALSRPVQAQPVRTLTIDDGQVRVDGVAVAPEHLPASLNLQGVRAHFTFSGDLRPVVQLEGRLFTVGEEGLTEVGEDTFVPSLAPGRDHDAAGIFSRPPSGRLSAPASQPAPVIPTARTTPQGGLPEVVFMQRQARALEAQAQGVARLREALSPHVEDRFLQEIAQHAQALQQQAAAAAEMAQQLPDIEAQVYIDRLQEQDRQLFERLMRERQLEAETLRLAREIAALPAGDRRRARTTELRTRLRHIFELKQENRRQEIARLEARLEGLQGRLEERERLRDRIIEQRLEQLVETAGQ